MSRPANDNHRRDALVFVAYWLALISLCLVVVAAVPFVGAWLKGPLP